MQHSYLRLSQGEFIALSKPAFSPQEDQPNYEQWKSFERRALETKREAVDGIPGWAWAQDKVAGWLEAVPNEKTSRDGGVRRLVRNYAESQNPYPS